MNMNANWGKVGLLGVVSVLALSACAGDAAMSSEASATNAEITNNQEEGVDEGGIVKNISDHLVILRQGRVFAVDVSQEANARQSSTIRVALDEHLNDSVWYDEMLVRGREIYVVGYRYAALLDDGESEPGIWWGESTGATEIAHFHLSEEGQLERKETLFFESMDYYDFSNYSSRMIGDELLFYMPLYQGDRGVPRRLKYEGRGEFRRGGTLYAEEDIVEMPEPADSSDDEYGAYRSRLVHTIVRCEVEDGQATSCDAQGVRGSGRGVRYITRDDVYLWGDELVWALSLADGSVSMHAARGVPYDQFSFDFEDGALEVVVSPTYNYDERDQPRAIELLRLEREAFDMMGGQEVQGTRLAEMSGSGYLTANRFADDMILFSTSDWSRDDSRSALVVVDRETRTSRSFDLDEENVSRIEPMRGVGALVVSSRYERRDRRFLPGKKLFGWDSMLRMRAFSLGEQGVEMTSTLELEHASEGETRSHGFFFKPGDSGGMFGLPIDGSRGFSGWWGSGVSNIAFFDVGAAGELAQIGAVSSSSAAEGKCETSCVDWYGNTRPIFLGDRVFALMGSELVEVRLDHEVRELDRLIMEF